MATKHRPVRSWTPNAAIKCDSACALLEIATDVGVVVVGIPQLPAITARPPQFSCNASVKLMAVGHTGGPIVGHLGIDLFCTDLLASVFWSFFTARDRCRTTT